MGSDSLESFERNAFSLLGVSSWWKRRYPNWSLSSERRGQLFPGAASSVSKRKGECRGVQSPEGAGLGRQRVKKVDLGVNLEKYARIRWYRVSQHSQEVSLEKHFSFIPFSFLFLFLPPDIYLFIWLCQVLLASCGIFSCGLWTLCCGIWDLVPWQGLNLRLLHWKRGVSHWATREALRVRTDRPVKRLW